MQIMEKEGSWKFQGGRGGGGSSNARKFLKYVAELEFPGGWKGSNQKLPWEG